MKPVLRYDRLRKSVHGQLLLDIDTLVINEQACVALSGRNGAGKSTLMRIIAGLEAPDSARVTLDGRTLGWRRAWGRTSSAISSLQRSSARA